MSKYDDVQRFKDKINMKDIDYKEFPKEDATALIKRWAIVEQVAGNGGTVSSILQPTLTNATEFSSGLQPQSQPVTNVKENKAVPGHVERTVPITAKVNHPPRQETPPVSSVQSHHFNSSYAGQAAVPQSDVKRFKNMFSKKTSPAGDREADRNTLLKPLLESIASCR
ncbi:cellulose biosynthesis protein BcsO [Serratia sp. UGAL515B_01]|uniref:cellulose biosynthesis protein BcsO n=1 Tax=Serratia sp. UGAL515B_01 TaxID=2986763 RepID=UPI0029542F2A|nr:cellulose biosynthesis protein BcsO [Serratia sp. UGAL515B_01]WON78077.1 cellulose biosynthesis protein BcsO [Serratia sp. UGAL515B_01]